MKVAGLFLLPLTSRLLRIMKMASQTLRFLKINNDDDDDQNKFDYRTGVL